MHPIFFISSSVSEHMCSFHVLAVNMGVWTSFWGSDGIFFREIPWGEIAKANGSESLKLTTSQEKHLSKFPTLISKHERQSLSFLKGSKCYPVQQIVLWGFKQTPRTLFDVRKSPSYQFLPIHLLWVKILYCVFFRSGRSCKCF